MIIAIVIVIFVVALFFVFKRNRPLRSTDKFDELYRKISEDIKYAVAPKSMQLSVGATELIELATEVWRIEQRLIKVSDNLPENQKKGLENSVHKLKTYISKYDVEIIDYTGKKFNDGLNLDVLNVEKDPNVEFPTVKETVEPTILVKGQVVKKAKIILLSN
jgi:molecular chaperone GrpE (heat shock protein)